jgi:chemotaxis protein CheC
VCVVTARPLDHDALTELFNIGLHRAAASLSELTGQRIEVELPRLWVCPIEETHVRLRELIEGELATVHQIFMGSVAGDAILVLEYEAASRLAALLTQGDVAPDGRLDQSAREVLTEVGNILLNACLGTFGNLLHVPVSFSVPEIDVASIRAVVDRVIGSGDAFRYALVVTAGFRLRDAEVTGYVVIVLTVQSLTRLLVAVEDWERRQG